MRRCLSCWIIQIYSISQYVNHTTWLTDIFYIFWQDLMDIFSSSDVRYFQLVVCQTQMRRLSAVCFHQTNPVSPLSSRRLFLSIILTFALWTLFRWGQTKGFSTAKKVVCWVLQNLRRPSNKISSNITSPLSCRSLFTPLQLYWYVVVV